MSKLVASVICAVMLLPAVARGEWKALGVWRVAAYCPCTRCCGKSDGITADGTHAPSAPHLVIAAPKEIPFGTRLWVEGVGTGVVHDRGRTLRGRRLELFFRNHRDALNWGVQHRRVFIWVPDGR